MKCEDCLPRIEEYVDGELDGRRSAQMESHLAACSSCARELVELKRDEEIYARYRRDLEVGPAQWNIVRARIEQEKEAGLKPAVAPVAAGLLGRLFNPRRLFRPATIAALVLILAGIGALFIYLNSRPNRTHLAAQEETPGQDENPQTAIKRAQTPPVITAAPGESLPGSADRKQNASTANQTPSVAINAPLPRKATTGQKKGATAAGTEPDEPRLARRPPPDPSAPFEIVAVAANTNAGVNFNAGENFGDFDSEVAHHAGRAELLLRSFRNVRLSDSGGPLDVSYEKEQSRRLLYRNIALRRDAASRGDQPTAELLSKLEPLLLDIANLPNRAKARDVLSIEKRMERKEIVATLQVRTLVASN